MGVQGIINELESLLNEIDEYNKNKKIAEDEKTALELERSYNLIRDGKEILAKIKEEEKE